MPETDERKGLALLTQNALTEWFRKMTVAHYLSEQMLLEDTLKEGKASGLDEEVPVNDITNHASEWQVPGTRA